MRRAAFFVLPVVALGIVLLLGASARFSLLAVPLPDLDTPSYLSPALSLLSGDGFQQAGGRDWLYPAILALVLKATGSFSALALVQQLLGLGAVLLLAGTWALWVSFFDLRPVGRMAALLAGLVPAYFQACNPLILFFELRIRPEAVLSFFVFAQMFCVVAFAHFRWRKAWPAASLVFGILSIVLAYADCLLKPSWLFAFFVTVLPVFLGVVGTFPRWARWATLLAGVSAALGLLWLPGKLFYKPDVASVTFLPSTLFTIHARLIKDTLAREEAGLPEGDSRKAELRAVLLSLAQEFRMAESRPGPYVRMGFDPDYLYYRSPLMGVIRESSGGTDASFRAFCFRAYFDTWRDQPGAMLEKIWSQFEWFLFPDWNSFYRSRIEFQKPVQTGVETLARMQPTVHGRGEELRQSLASLLAGPRVSEARISSNSPARLVTAGAVALSFLLPLLALFGIGLVHFQKALSGYRLAGWVALLFYAAPAANAFTVAVSHALDENRYRQSYGSFVVFGLTALAVFVITVLITFFGQMVRRSSASDR